MRPGTVYAGAPRSGRLSFPLLSFFLRCTIPSVSVLGALHTRVRIRLTDYQSNLFLSSSRTWDWDSESPPFL